VLRFVFQERVAAGLRAPQATCPATRRESFNFARKSSVLMLAQGDKAVFDTSKLPAEECVDFRIVALFSRHFSIANHFLICIFAFAFCH
jgi:hypothetical protein